MSTTGLGPCQNGILLLTRTAGYGFLTFRHLIAVQISGFAQPFVHTNTLLQSRFDTDLLLAVHSGETIYIRFDLNDYSIPPESVGRPLMVATSSPYRAS